MTVVPHAVCTFCGCTCDDIELHTEGARILKAVNACSLGESGFTCQSPEPNCPAALIEGKPAALEAAIEAAVHSLANTRYPLIYGLRTMTCEAQHVAVMLAETLGGVIDHYTSIERGAAEIAVQTVGKSTATLGEIKNRADLLIYWGANPAKSHPRHLDRYTLAPEGMFVPAGRSDRTLVVVDIHPTATTSIADVFLQIHPNQDFEAITALRAMIKGRPLNTEQIADTGLTTEQLQDLAERMKRARYGAIFFGSGLSMKRGCAMNAAALFMLGQEMNEFTRFVTMPLHSDGNGAGASAATAWMTAYPFGIDFSRGYARYNPGEFTAVDLLSRGEVDAALLLVADSGIPIPGPALDHLSRIPTILLGPLVTQASQRARVHITTAATGVSAPGTVYRMDEVPLQLRPALPSPFPTD